MGFSFSGVVINHVFDETTTNSFSNRFDFDALQFDKEVPFEKALKIDFENQYLDFYTTKDATIVFCSSPDLGDRMNLEKASFGAKAGFFVVDETSMTMMATLLEHTETKLQYSQVLNEVKPTFNNGFESTSRDGFQLALDVIKHVSGVDFFKIENVKLKRFKVSSGRVALSATDIQFNEDYRNYLQQRDEIEVIEPATIAATNTMSDQGDKLTVFKNLSSVDNEVVKSQLGKLSTTSDPILVNYVLMVSLYHPDRAARAFAKKVVKTQASESLQAHVLASWESKFLKDQSVNRNKLLMHEEINQGECLCLFQVLRRNYFSVYAAAGYNLYLDGRGDTIGEVFDSFLFTLKELPDTFELLEHVRYINLVKETQLNIHEALKRIVRLPNVKTLKLEEVGLRQFPEELFQLQKLERLVLRNNKITTIPDAGVLPELKVLELSECEIPYLDLKMFPNIKEIWMAKWTLERMDIVHIPRAIKITTGPSYSEILDVPDHRRTHSF